MMMMMMMMMMGMMMMMRRRRRARGRRRPAAAVDERARGDARRAHRARRDATKHANGARAREVWDVVISSFSHS